MASFWSVALGYEIEPPPAGYLSWKDFLRANDLPLPANGSIAAIVDPDEAGPRVVFLRSPKNTVAARPLQFDIRTDRSDHGKEATIAELTEAGATEVRRVDERGGWWIVMADPEGNEFCVT